MSPEEWMASQNKKPLSPEEWMAAQSQPRPAQDQKSMLVALGAGIGQGVGNVALGAQNLLGMGLEKVGLDSAGQWLQNDATQGKAKLAGEVAPYAEQYPMTTGGGKLAGEIVATLPVGGVLAKGASMLPGLSASAPIVQALRTGGLTAGGGGMGTRMLASGLTGGVSSALINPEDTLTGATVGAAFPAVVAGAGKAGQAVGRALRPASVKTAEKIADITGKIPSEIKSAIADAQLPNIPGYQPTVPQALMTPELSQLQRNLKTMGVNAIGDAEQVQQQQLLQALESIAPAAASPIDAAQSVGSRIEKFARQAKGKSSEAIKAAFDAVDPENATRLYLPIDQMKASKAKFLGAGTFGGTNLPQSAINTAEEVARYVEKRNPITGLNDVYSQGVPFGVIQNLRSSTGEAAKKMASKGADREAAALGAMVSNIDEEINRVAFSPQKGNEFFPDDAADRYRAALDLAKEGKERFKTGPQAGIFRAGGDGQPALQGAEIPSRFYSPKLSQADDVAAFKRLVKNDQDLVNELKKFAVTEGVFTSDAQGNLGNKFIKWARARSGANQQLFSPDDLSKIESVSKAVERQIRTEGLGRVSGSDTAQKLSTLQSNGVLDNRVVDLLANRIPLVGSFTGPALQSLRNTSQNTRNKAIAELLADPQKFQAALGQAQGDFGLITDPKKAKALAGALRAGQFAAPAIIAQ